MKIQIKKGLDLPIAGAVTAADVRSVPAATAAVVPDDFAGFQPKVDVAVGDSVLAGDALMHDKRFPALKLVSPLCGKVVEENRGERRRLLKVVVEAAGDDFK